jgi:hypothetical protein
MRRINIAEEGHVVNILPPQDINGGAVTSDYFALKNYAHATIILTLGVTGAASTVTLEESDDNAGSSTTAIGFNYYKEETDSGDTLSTKQTATTSGFATSTNDNITYLIEVDGAELSDGKPYLVLKMTDPEASTLVSAVAVLSGSRYGRDESLTAIT